MYLLIIVAYININYLKSYVLSELEMFNTLLPLRSISHFLTQPAAPKSFQVKVKT